MRLDMHTHAFHPKIARKAVAHLNSAYDLTCEGDGTIAHLLEQERAAGIDMAAVLCAATTPSQVIPANNYALELQRTYPDRVLAFGTCHPGFDRWGEELDRLERNGIAGIKLHPDFQGFRLDDPALLPILDACQGRFVLLTHVGSRLPPARRPSTPAMLARIAAAFPRLTIIAAHFGGYRMWEHTLTDLPPSDNLWCDTSSTSPYASPELLRALMTHFPPDRLLFGTDWPLSSPEGELRRFQEKSGLSDSRMDALMSNALPLFAQVQHSCSFYGHGINVSP